ncbi:MAG: hypothetical protein V3W18_14920 [candidate division Zixibacteria bacterium]
MSRDRENLQDAMTEKSDSSDNKDNIIEKYTRIQINEHHFNKMETEIRKLASVWLLASLGAIAFFVRGAYLGEGGETITMLPPKALISIICMMGTIGLLVLWILDQMVYHRLLNAVFLLGLRMEYLHESLPPIRTLMFLFSRRLGMSRYLRWYYLVPMFGLGMIGLFSSLWYTIEKSFFSESIHFTSYIPLTVSLATFLIPILVSLTSKKTETTDLYETNAMAFGDDDFVSYLSQKDYEKVLSRH